jgi:putative PEP-CTERM system TPR-repeat lipoprotein
MPDDARVKTSLALTHLARGDAETAFGELATVAASSPSILAEQAAFAARLRRREFDAALALVDQIAKKAPKDLAQFELRGRVFLARKDFVQARKAFEAELAADPKIFAASANLATIDILEKKPDEARKRLQANIAADPKNVYAIMALAELQSSTGAPLDEIKALLNQAIKAAPQQSEPRLQLIALTLRKRLFKEALVAAQEASVALPNDMAVMDAVGRAQMEAGDVEQAISTFRKMAGATTTSGVAYTRLADIYKATGKRDQAEAVLRKALEVEPGLVPAQTALVDLLFATKRQAEALDFIKREQRNSPGSTVGYGMEALYHLRNKAPDAAVAAYRDGLAKTKSKVMAVALHRLLTRLNQQQAAEQLAANWMKEHPEDLVFAYQVAEAAIGRSQFDEAEKRLTRLQSLEPNNALILNNLASVIVKQGKAGALPYAQKAADLVPDNSSILDTLASALAAEKEFDKALSTQKRAVELAPDTDSLRLNLASIALKAGDKALARTELTRLQALGAKFKQQDEVTRLLKAS